VSAKWRRRWRFVLRLPLHAVRFVVFMLEAFMQGYEYLLDAVEHDLVVAKRAAPAVESDVPASSPAHWRRGPEDDQSPFMVPPS